MKSLPVYILVRKIGPLLLQRPFFLCHFGAELLAAQDMEMQMMHGLAGICAAVGNHTVAVFQLFCLGDS